MKHLKTYKLFEGLSNIEDYCRDILLELDDIGFKTIVSDKSKRDAGLSIRQSERIEIFLSKVTSFTVEDISDTIYSIGEYLKTQGFYKDEKEVTIRHLDRDSHPQPEQKLVWYTYLNYWKRK